MLLNKEVKPNLNLSVLVLQPHSIVAFLLSTIGSRLCS